MVNINELTTQLNSIKREADLFRAEGNNNVNNSATDFSIRQARRRLGLEQLARADILDGIVLDLQTQIENKRIEFIEQTEVAGIIQPQNNALRNVLLLGGAIILLA